MGRQTLVSLFAATMLPTACTVLSAGDPVPDDGAPIGTVAAPLKLAAVDPVVEVYVKNAGALDVETEYLPKVVCCEHGGAHPEALKAQAVMARTYMYFSYFGTGLGKASKPLTGTTSDQAYFCATPVSQDCKDAVSATAGQITAYAGAGGELFANVSFFVAGPKPACLGSGSCDCPKPSPTTPMTPTSHPSACDCFTFSSTGGGASYVTYNWDKTGSAVKGSSIGNPTAESNRGCASQNIQNCLARAGFSYVDQLRMFYGQDIQLRLPDGSLVGSDDGDADAGAGPGSPIDAGKAAVDGGTARTPASPEPDAAEEADAPAADADSTGCQVRASRKAAAPWFAEPLSGLVVGILLARRLRRSRPRATPSRQ